MGDLLVKRHCEEDVLDEESDLRRVGSLIGWLGRFLEQRVSNCALIFWPTSSKSCLASDCLLRSSKV